MPDRLGDRPRATGGSVGDPGDRHAAWLTFVLVDLAEAAPGRDAETASWAASRLDEMAEVHGP